MRGKRRRCKEEVQKEDSVKDSSSEDGMDMVGRVIFWLDDNHSFVDRPCHSVALGLHFPEASSYWCLPRSTIRYLGYLSCRCISFRIGTPDDGFDDNQDDDQVWG